VLFYWKRMAKLKVANVLNTSTLDISS